MDIIYVCTICGWENRNRESVERCENSHVYKHQIEITNLQFENGDGIPKKSQQE